MSAVVPTTAIHAVELYRTATRKNAVACLAISAYLTKNPSILVFNRRTVEIHSDNITPGADKETVAFIEWLKQRTYTMVVTKDGKFNGEVDPKDQEKVAEYQQRIAVHETNEQEMRRKIGALEQKERDLLSELQTVKADSMRLNASRFSEETTAAQKIICMEQQVSVLECEKKGSVERIAHKDALIEGLSLKISEFETTQKQLKTDKEVLVHEHAKIRLENTALEAESQSLSSRLTVERRCKAKPVQSAGKTMISIADGFFNAITPPVVTQFLKFGAAPLGKLTAYMLDKSDTPKRKHDDDADQEAGAAKKPRRGT